MWLPKSGKDGHWIEVFSMPWTAAGDPFGDTGLKRSGRWPLRRIGAHCSASTPMDAPIGGAH